MNNSRYQTIIHFPFWNHIEGELKGHYIEIVHKGQKITGVVMEMDYHSFVVDITSPFWNASKGFMIDPLPVHNFAFEPMLNTVNQKVAKHLLLELYLDCQHAYENAPSGFWENPEFRKYYLREAVPYEQQSEHERFYGAQIPEEVLEMYHTSRDKINWPQVYDSYKRRKLMYIKKQRQIEEQEFPGSRFEGNLVEIFVEGQKVQGEVLWRDIYELELKIRYPFDGLIDKAVNKHGVYPLTYYRFMAYDHLAGEFAARRLLKELYLRGQALAKHLEKLLIAYQKYQSIKAELKADPLRRQAEKKVQALSLKLKELRAEFNAGKLTEKEYKELFRPHKSQRKAAQKEAQINLGTLYKQAFADMLHLPYFREYRSYIFDVAENPEIVRGKYQYQKYPKWYVPAPKGIVY